MTREINASPIFFHRQQRVPHGDRFRCFRGQTQGDQPRPEQHQVHAPVKALRVAATTGQFIL